MIVLYAMGVGIHLARDGQPMRMKYSFLVRLIGVAASAFILYCGGFWTGGNQ